MISALITAATSMLGGLSWKPIAIALTLGAAAALWFWIADLRSDLALLRVEKAQLSRNVAMHRALVAERDRALEAFAEAEARAAARRDAANQAREEVRDAPATDDGPLAPVLSRALERLR